MPQHLRAHLRPAQLLTWLLTVALVVAAVATAVRQHTWGPVSPGHQLPLVLLLVVLVCSAGIETPLTLKGQSIGVEFSETGLAVAVLFGPTPYLVVMVAVSTLVLEVAHRRFPIKAVFNVAAHACGAGAAVAAAHVVLGGSDPSGLSGWVTVAALVTAADLTTFAATLVVVWVHNGFDLGDLSSRAVAEVAALGISIVVAIITVAAMWANPWTLALLALAPIAATVAYRSYVGLASRYANLEVLYDVTRRVAGLAEYDEVLDAVLEGVLEGLSADTAQVLCSDGTSWTCRQRRSDGSRATSTVEDPPVVELLGAERAVVVGRGSKGRGAAALAAAGLNDLVAARIPDDEEREWVLVVADRLGAESFGRSDLRLMEAVAAQAAVALRSARLLHELRTSLAQREQEALHDGLTTLGNRALFTGRAAVALRERVPGGLVAIMLLDLDGFKEVNDTLGHHTGDVVLRQIGLRLREAVGARGVPTRLGGDEFAIVLPDPADLEEVWSMARGVFDAVRQPMETSGIALSVQASIGIALSPEHGVDVAALLKGADVAMYAAKDSPGRITLYEPTEDRHTTRRLLLATDLRRAVDAGALDVHYQPKVELATGRVLGFEALLRWNHPSYGDVAPSEFIPVAEQSGSIETITWWVLGEALRQQRRWAARGYDLTVAVNISARSLLDSRLVERLRDLLAQCGVAPNRLTLEVTETSVMADVRRSTAILEEVAALGVEIAIDDFGTGYSSLTRLAGLPVGEIKVDKSFVQAMLQSPDTMAIVSSTVELVRSLGRRATAEGVEDAATLEVLRSLGCDAAQGYLLARPMAPAEALEWLEHPDEGAAPSWSADASARSA